MSEIHSIQSPVILAIDKNWDNVENDLDESISTKSVV
jgi:hypothetical protein